MNHSTPHSHADTERYTRDEMVDDLNDWASASKEQRSEAFTVLLAAITADAYHKQDADLIARLRRIRTKRDGVGAPAVVPVCAWCSLPAGHTGDHAPLGQVEPPVPGVL